MVTRRVRRPLSADVGQASSVLALLWALRARSAADAPGAGPLLLWPLLVPRPSTHAGGLAVGWTARAIAVLLSIGLPAGCIAIGLSITLAARSGWRLRPTGLSVRTRIAASRRVVVARPDRAGIRAVGSPTLYRAVIAAPGHSHTASGVEGSRRGRRPHRPQRWCRKRRRARPCQIRTEGNRASLWLRTNALCRMATACCLALATWACSAHRY